MSGRDVNSNSERFRNFETVVLKIRIPLMVMIVIEVGADVVYDSVLFSICLENNIRPCMLLDICSNTITSLHMNWTISVNQRHGHLYLQWPTQIMFTVTELKKVHQHLFHTQLDWRFQLLCRYDPNNTTTQDSGKLVRTTKELDVCQWLANTPNRLQASISHTHCVFNRSVCIDVMMIWRRTVLHAVDKLLTW